MSTPALFLPALVERPRSTPVSPSLGPLLSATDDTMHEFPRATIIAVTDGEKSHAADRRLWRARKGEPGVYRAYPSADEKIIFRVWSVLHHETGERITRVYLVTHWKNGELVKRFRRDEPQPYLPLRVLSGRFKLNTIPEEHRTELAPVARLFTNAARHYDDECKEWRERSR